MFTGRRGAVRQESSEADLVGATGASLGVLSHSRFDEETVAPTSNASGGREFLPGYASHGPSIVFVAKLPSKIPRRHCRLRGAISLDSILATTTCVPRGARHL